VLHVMSSASLQPVCSHACELWDIWFQHAICQWGIGPPFEGIRVGSGLGLAVSFRMADLWDGGPESPVVLHLTIWC